MLKMKGIIWTVFVSKKILTSSLGYINLGLGYLCFRFWFIHVLGFCYLCFRLLLFMFYCFGHLCFSLLLLEFRITY
jgi:hypothetical protein